MPISITEMKYKFTVETQKYGKVKGRGGKRGGEGRGVVMIFRQIFK